MFELTRGSGSQKGRASHLDVVSADVTGHREYTGQQAPGSPSERGSVAAAKVRWS